MVSICHNCLTVVATFPYVILGVHNIVWCTSAQWNHTWMCMMMMVDCALAHCVVQEEYYVTHQCFLTNRGLYLLVWNVKDGLPGIESLNIWLQNLQVRTHVVYMCMYICMSYIDPYPMTIFHALVFVCTSCIWFVHIYICIIISMHIDLFD